MINYDFTNDDARLVLLARKRFDKDVANKIFDTLRDDDIDKVIGYVIAEVLEDINLHSQAMKFMKMMDIRYRDQIRLMNGNTRTLSSTLPDKTTSYISNTLMYDVYLVYHFILGLLIEYDYLISDNFGNLTRAFLYQMEKTLRL